MAYEHIEFEIEGVPPGSMMHNGRLANPLDKITQEIKFINKKGVKKTDADHLEVIRLEWYGGLYTNEDGRIIWPGQNIEGMFLKAGKKRRQGDAFKGGLICPEDPLLLYDGPTDVDKLWQAGKNLDVRNIRLKRGPTVLRARPYFPKWGLVFTVGYLPDLLNERDVIEALETASVYVGLSDYAPKFGRFTIKRITKK